LKVYPFIQKAEEDKKIFQKEIENLKIEVQQSKDKISMFESLTSERRNNKSLDASSKSVRKNLSETKSPSRVDNITDRKL
jgi:hypothetical protein